MSILQLTYTDNLTCDFETSQVCGFTQDTTDDFDFWWHAGSTQSTSTGPRTDNTFKNASGRLKGMAVAYPRQTPWHKAKMIFDLGDRAFAGAGPNMWYDSPLEIRKSPSLIIIF